jgi:hypothetical protein
MQDQVCRASAHPSSQRRAQESALPTTRQAANLTTIRNRAGKGAGKPAVATALQLACAPASTEAGLDPRTARSASLGNTLTPPAHGRAHEQAYVARPRSACVNQLGSSPTSRTSFEVHTSPEHQNPFPSRAETVTIPDDRIHRPVCTQRTSASARRIGACTCERALRHWNVRTFQETGRSL